MKKGLRKHFLTKNISNLISNFDLNLTLLDQIIISGINFTTSILLARFLGIENFGYFTLIWISILLISSIQNALIVSPMLSISPKLAGNEKNEYLSSLFLFQATLIIFLFIIALILFLVTSSLVNNSEFQKAFVPAVITMIFMQIQEYLRRYYFVTERVGIGVINDFLNYGGKLILICFGSILGFKSLAQVFWYISLANILAIICAIGAIRELQLTLVGIKENFKKTWNFSSWLCASAILQWGSGNVFLMVAGLKLGVVDLGAIRAIQNIYGLVNVFFQGLENTIPITAGKCLFTEGFSALKRYLKAVSFIGGLLVILVSVVVMTFADIIMGSLYGDEYLKYDGVFFWFGIITILNYFVFSPKIGLRALEYTKPIFIGFVMAAVWSILSANILVENLNIYGVVIGLIGVALIKNIYWRLSFNSRGSVYRDMKNVVT